MDVVRKLKSRLALLGMTTGELASAVGVSRATLYRWFDQNCQPIPLDVLRKIGAALKLTETDFVDIFLPKYSQERE